MKSIALSVLVFCALAIGGGCQSSSPSTKRMLPRDPTFDAIHDRLGDPDRITGSGRSFLHYDFKNGQTLTRIVSGNEIIGAEIPRLNAESPNKPDAGDGK
jgi:hypothetical protein